MSETLFQARIELLQRDPKALAFLAVRCVQRSLREKKKKMGNIIISALACKTEKELFNSNQGLQLHIIKGPHSLKAQETLQRKPFILGRAERQRERMASLPQPMDYYPTSNSIMHAQPATTSKGSFGPVFAVLAVISFLAVAACVVGRLCGRRLSKKKSSADHQFYGSDAVGGDLEKGFEIKYPAMKPMASSRAMIHDIEDGFEIKFTPGKPAAWKNDSKADNKGQQHHPQPGMPKDYAMPKEYAGFRYPANGVVRQGQIRGGTFVSAKPST